MSEADGLDPVEALFGAIEEGDLAGVRAALAAGADPRARHGILEKPAILEAADHPELLRALLEAGAEADSADPGGETALLAAARTATLESVRALLAAGADVRRADGDGMTALLWAVWWSRQKPGEPTRPGYLETLRVLLEAGADTGAVGHGDTALHMAAGLGDPEIVGLLLGAGADPAAADEQGCTPARRAVRRGFGDVAARIAARAAAAGKGPEWIAWLADPEAGAKLAAWLAEGDPDSADPSGLPALHWAACLGSAEAVRALARRGAKREALAEGETALGAAARLGRVSAALALVEAGARPGPADEDGRTALHHAAARGDRELVRALVGIGAHRAKTKQRESALYRAVCEGHEEVASDLLAAGMDPDAGPYSVLAQAASRGQTSLVQRLLQAGAEARKKGGAEALLYAASAGHVEVVRLLLAAGADGDAKDESRETPLMRAAKEGHVDVVLALAEAGASLEAKAEGFTALMLAAQGGRTDVVEALLAAGARVKGKGKLLAAVVQGDLATVKAELARKADPDVAESAGSWPALLWASLLGREAIAAELVAAKAEVGRRSKLYPPTALQAAAGNGHAGIVRRLAAAGALSGDPTEGPEALQRAARRGHPGAVSALLEAGVDPDALAERGQPALIVAAQEGRLACVQALLAGGADPAAKTRLGMGAAEEAALKGHPEIETLLRQAAQAPRRPKLAPAPAPVTAPAGEGARKQADPAVAEALCTAARAGDLEALRRLLAEGADPDAEFKRIPVLLFALGAEQEEAALALLAAGADAARAGEAPHPPLVVAATRRLPRAARAILRAVHPDGKPKTDLYRAIASSDAARVRELLAGGKAAPAEPLTKWPPLLWACLLGEREIVKDLLAAKADPCVQKNGWNPLGLAYAARDAGLMQLLLGAGADPDGTVPPGLKLLVQAVRDGQVELARLLLEGGANANVSVQGGTPLHLAVDLGHAEIAELLVRRGAKLEAKDGNKRTPLVAAVQYGRTAALERLLAAGAKADVKWQDRSALHWAVAGGRREATWRLLAAKASALTADKEGETALHAAARRGDLALAEALLAAQADPRAASQAGRTPLIEAARAGSARIVRRLLEAGADPAARDAAGRSAADLAAEEGEDEVVALLAAPPPSPAAALAGAALAGQAGRVRELLDGRPAGDLVAAMAAAQQEGFDEVAALLQTAGAKPAFEPPPEGPGLVAVDAVMKGAELPNLPLLWEGKVGRYHTLPSERFGASLLGKQWTHPWDLRPLAEDVDPLLAEQGFPCLGTLLCDRLADVMVRGYGSPDGSAWGSWNQGLFEDALDFVTDFEDGTSLTTTTAEPAPWSAERRSFGRSWPGASPAVLLHKHRQRVARRVALGMRPRRAEPTLLALAQAIDAFLARKWGR